VFPAETSRGGLGLKTSRELREALARWRVFVCLHAFS
jgi:hypothetical protein